MLPEKNIKTKAAEPTKTLPDQSTQKDGEAKDVEKLAVVEWGERIDSGKAIARGGKNTGFVPGATPSK